jgi:hypothetical protein
MTLQLNLQTLLGLIIWSPFILAGAILAGHAIGFMTAQIVACALVLVEHAAAKLPNRVE